MNSEGNAAVRPMSGGSIRWLAYAIVVLVPLLMAAAGWRLCPPMLNPDSAMGFYVWEAREAGGSWNCLCTPDPANIAIDHDEFLSWWSPGQYQLPGLLRLLGFTWGHVVLLTALAGCWIEVLGCWRLARATGAGPEACAWFCLASTLQWHTLFSFGHFRGGDVILNAAAPWMLLWAWQVRFRPGWFLASIPVMLAGGLYLKLSAMLLVAPLLLAAGLANGWRLHRRLLLLGFWAVASGLLAAATWMAVQKGYLSRGPTPDAASAWNREAFSPVAFAILSPWLAATGAGNLIGRIYWWLGWNVDSLWLTGGWIVAPVAVAAWWWTGRCFLRPLAEPFRTGLIIFVGTSIVLFALLFFRHSAVGVDDRYMRPTATVLLLALAMNAESVTPMRRRLAVIGLTAIVLFGLGSAVQRCVSLARMHSCGREDVTQQCLSAATIARFARLDSQGDPRSMLIYVPWAGIGLEIRRQRALITDDLSISRQHHWQGRVPALVVSVPDVMESDGRGALARSQFADYRAAEWHGEHCAGWWFWTAGNLALKP